MNGDGALAQEVGRRRTFAIISHPDAGKTTLTEKLLLYGGAIVTAGQVAARRRQRAATSDWMELERERGISITSTVLQFPYRGFTMNLLDTPGHQDFGEDTYRTLLAADSAVMLLDAAKGVEPQTKKLFAICRARRIPLFTFINKMDRPSRDPLELIDELESVLGIGAYPVNWPIGNGPSFRGVFDRASRRVHLFERTHARREAGAGRGDGRARPAGRGALTIAATYKEFLDGVDLLDGAGAAFDPATVSARRRDAGVFRQRGDELRRRAVPRRIRRHGAAAGRPASPPSAATAGAKRSHRSPITSPVSCSRFRPTWIRAIATASRSCASARAGSSAT